MKPKSELLYFQVPVNSIPEMFWAGIELSISNEQIMFLCICVFLYHFVFLLPPPNPLSLNFCGFHSDNQGFLKNACFTTGSSAF